MAMDAVPLHVKPTPANCARVHATNLEDGETVHQRCIIITGRYQHETGQQPGHFAPRAHPDDYVMVALTDAFEHVSAAQNWPAKDGHWKVMVMLQPGRNQISLQLFKAGLFVDCLEATINYLPLTQLPPLHLAILVAKDSLLLIDCPPLKRGAISSTHSSLDAAVAKLRMTAYMWQAMIAEDMREKGLGRTSFRLDEVWGPDTTSMVNQSNSSVRFGNTAFVHIVESKKTVAEIRKCAVGQRENGTISPDSRCKAFGEEVHGRFPSGGHLPASFRKALEAYGAPFTSASNPVVAGLILDSHFNSESGMIDGHAAHGEHRPNGISLAVFGSHLTYSWPRFLEEIPDCLSDLSRSEDKGAFGYGGPCKQRDAEYTIAQACCVSQGAFLRQVGQAFGAGRIPALSVARTPDVVGRSYADGWHQNFIAHAETEQRVAWSLRDTLKFRLKEHFRAPGVTPLAKSLVGSEVLINLTVDDDGDEYIEVSCTAGIGHCALFDDLQSVSGKYTICNRLTHGAPSSLKHCMFSISDLETDFDRTKPLTVYGLGLNGEETRIENVWDLLRDRPYIYIPESKVKLGKQSVTAEQVDQNVDTTSWAMLLTRKAADGQLVSASAIDLRVGCTMDGAVVYYKDETSANCGDDRDPSHFGGHASEKCSIPLGAEIVKVELNRSSSWGNTLDGIRMTLKSKAMDDPNRPRRGLSAYMFFANDQRDKIREDNPGLRFGKVGYLLGEKWKWLANEQKASYEAMAAADKKRYEEEKAVYTAPNACKQWGKLNQEDEGDIVALEPGTGDRIVGFFGRSEQGSGFTVEFGILTAPNDMELPDAVYDLPEFRTAVAERQERRMSGSRCMSDRASIGSLEQDIEDQEDVDVDMCETEDSEDYDQ